MTTGIVVEEKCVARSDQFRVLGLMLVVPAFVLMMVAIVTNSWYDYDSGHRMGLFDVCYNRDDVYPEAGHDPVNQHCSQIDMGEVSGPFHLTRAFAILGVILLPMSVLFCCLCVPRKKEETKIRKVGRAAPLLSGCMYLLGCILFAVTDVPSDFSRGSSGHLAWSFILAIVGSSISIISWILINNLLHYKRILKVVKWKQVRTARRYAKNAAAPFYVNEDPLSSSPGGGGAPSGQTRSAAASGGNAAPAVSNRNRADRTSGASSRGTGHQQRADSNPNIFVIQVNLNSPRADRVSTQL